MIAIEARGSRMTRYDFSALIEGGHTIGRLGLVVERGPAGVSANVRHVVWHSPPGVDFGYAGSGPSDLALSALCALISPPDPCDEERMSSLPPGSYERASANDRLWSMRTPSGERISRLAWRLHRPFETTFVMTMRGDFGYVPLEIMESWIDVQSRSIIERACRS